MMAAPPAAPIEIKVDLGPMPNHAEKNIMCGLRELLDRSELCDIILLVGGQSFLAHRAVLAAVSNSFHECLSRIGAAGTEEGAQPGAGPKQEQMALTLEEITHPEAVRLMLHCIYGVDGVDGNAIRDYSPGSEDINRDVIRLAQRFQISQLQDQANRWLTKGLNTGNILERLVVCEEFGLVDAREKILDQLISNPSALAVLVNDPEITKVPVVLQDLLVRVLKLLGCEVGEKRAAPAPPAGRASAKVPRRAGA